MAVDWDTKGKEERYGKNDDDDHSIYSDNLKDLVQGLLTRIPEDRLGSKNGHEEILNHDAFKDLKNDSKKGSPDDKEEGFVF